MRKILIIIMLTIVSCDNVGERNRRNLSKVHIGMDLNQVHKIMGRPDTVYKWNIDSGFYRLVYTAPPLASDQLYIFIDENDSVVCGIGKGE